MLELLLRGLTTESIMEAMDVLLEHLRSLPVEEQAPVAVLLLHFDALVCNFTTVYVAHNAYLHLNFVK